MKVDSIKVYESGLGVVEIYVTELIKVAKDFGADEYISDGERTLEGEIGKIVTELYNRDYRKGMKL